MKMVTAIMPTRGRKELAQRALDSFFSQTYPNKELIIFDDDEDPSFPDEREMERMKGRGVLYRRWRGDKPMSIAQKRNHCARMADGRIIIHFDSDDWSAPDRMADQVRRLEESGLQVTGYRSMLFYQVETGRAFRYSSPFSNYAIGTSLCYFRSWWERFHFDEALKKAWGEDNAFVDIAKKEKQIICVDAGPLMVARIHEGNTCKKDLHGDNYAPVDVVQLPKGFLN
jgi:glycosyltransferase involved in cell wall biosynthesis